MYEYFYKELDEAGIERPRKTLPENGFLRWGQNNRYWAKKFPLGDDVLFGDWQKPEYRGIASEKEESSLTPEERRQRQKQIEEIIKANEEEKRERQKEAAEHASSLWKIFPSISGNYD